MMMLARVIRLDDSDLNVYETAAEPGEWAISGSFAFSDWTEADLADTGTREAFAHGWLGLDTFGRGSLVAVAPITVAEHEALVERLAQHFLERFGAPSMDAARPVAQEEIAQMRALCEDQDPNTMIVLERVLEDVGVRERFRLVPPASASLEAFAVHGEIE